MLPAVNRLKREQDFKQLAFNGRYGFSSLLTVKYHPNKLSVSRFGFVVSTKIDKRATVRNRLKRQVREVIRLGLSHIRPGWDIMIVMKKGGVGKKYRDLEQDLISVLKKAKLYVD